MTQSPDHPELLYIEALKTDGSPMYTIGRPDGPPLWIVIHDMEAVESQSCAENTANYFHTGAGGRSVSSHYCADNNSIVQCVLLRHSAWTVGNRPGNNRGINWELCGFAAQTREQWLDAFGVAMFDRMVPIINSDAAKYNIPLVKRTVAELTAYKPGVTSHNDLRLAFGGTTHTDPGTNFPWDVFMAKLTGGSSGGGDDDMSHQDAQDGATLTAAGYDQYGHPTGPGSDLIAQYNAAAVEGRLTKLIADGFAEIKALIGTGGGGGGGGPVDLTPAALDAIEARVDKQLDEIAD